LKPTFHVVSSEVFFCHSPLISINRAIFFLLDFRRLLNISSFFTPWKSLFPRARTYPACPIFLSSKSLLNKMGPLPLTNACPAGRNLVPQSSVPNFFCPFGHSPHLDARLLSLSPPPTSPSFSVNFFEGRFWVGGGPPQRLHFLCFRRKISTPRRVESVPLLISVGPSPRFPSAGPPGSHGSLFPRFFLRKLPPGFLIFSELLVDLCSRCAQVPPPLNKRLSLSRYKHS